MQKFRDTVKLVFLTTLLGSLFGMILYAHHLDDITVFSEHTHYYFLHKGSFQTQELVRANTREINTKLVIEEEGLYHVYVAITRDSEVRDRITELYRERNIELHSKEKSINNMEFQNNIDQFDLLIRNSRTLEEINSISAVVLSNFEQTIGND